MGKLADLEAFDRVQILGAQLMGYSISEIIRQRLRNCKKQLALTVWGERRLRRIVGSRRSQTLAQITTQLNEGASKTVKKRIVQRSLYLMGIGSRRPTSVSLLTAPHQAARFAWTREHKDWSIEDCKRIAWSDES
ncbi:HTH_Tnp_Tc3_2 domain-containing protein [Trichonephila clavipes]|nr:HTH_Tnp_Tc3_2 domain-containing protein [Trichonephila clavipes]